MNKFFGYFVALLALLAIGYFVYQGSVEQGNVEQGSVVQGTAENKNIKIQQGQKVLFQTNKGNFTVELYVKESPKTVSNFVEYIKADFYSSTIFHRAIPGVILQGGGFNSQMVKKKTRVAIDSESGNQLLNSKGTIAMARKTSPNSATSQFFINLRDNANLDQQADKQGYTVFGKVVDGLELLTELSKSKTKELGKHKRVPIDEIEITSVKIIVAPKLKEIGKQQNAKLDSQTLTDEKFVEGVHYVLLKEPVPLINSHKVEVVGAFSYGCGHCYGLYPLTQEWKLKNNKKITFSYFHAVWSEAMRIYARTYYTAIELKVEKQIHLPLYETIVINQQKLSERDELATFFESFGVERSKFVEVFDSQTIIQRVEQAEKLTKAFNLASVPEFIVAGKFRIDPSRAGGTEEIFEVMDFLIEKEKALSKK